MAADGRSEEVQATLLRSARVFTASAVAAYLEEEYEVFLMHAATAAELLLKASLCERHVALIAEAVREGDRHFRSLAALLGIEVPGGATAGQQVRRPSSIKTIGAEEALRRVGAFVPQLRSGREKEGLSALFAQRNGVVHFGEVAARGDAVHLRPPFVMSCEVLLADIGYDSDRFWGTNSQIVARWGREAKAEVEQDIHDKLESARRRYQLLPDVLWHSHVYEDVHDDLELTEALTAAILDCPVCGLPCIVSGYPEAAAESGETAVALEIERLACKVCGLQLWGATELAVARVPQSVLLPDATERDVDAFYDRG